MHKPANYFAPLDDEREDQVIEYVPDPEPVCYACRKERHEYCVEKKGLECWCEEQTAHEKGQ